MTTEFKSDGCTLFPEGNWHDCCVAHDIAYYYGGGEDKRLRADINLLKCVAEAGHPYIATVMFLGVRVFGGPHWTHRLRWGRKHKYRDSFTYKKQEGIKA